MKNTVYTSYEELPLLPNVKKLADLLGVSDSVKNYFPVPNVIFNLELHPTEVVIYSYLMSIEARRTYQCVVSCPTMAKKPGLSVNTVAKYVGLLEEHGLIRTEHTDIFTKSNERKHLKI